MYETCYLIFPRNLFKDALDSVHYSTSNRQAVFDVSLESNLKVKSS